jgi:hypothetical protein
VQTQINIFTPEEVLFFWYSSSSSKGFFSQKRDRAQLIRGKASQ